MHDLILSELAKIETEHDVRVLLAVESGSRAWGFSSQDSDWDVWFIYIHRREWYLSIEHRRDVIEAMLPSDLDFAGWDLKKALGLFYKSNPPLMEWLHSPITYWENAPVVHEWRSLVPSYHSPEKCILHYLHMAEGNVQDYINREQVPLKKYLYVLRPLLACRYIETVDSWAPMEFDRLLQATVHDPLVKDAIERLVEQKRMGGEMGVGDPIEVLDAFIYAEIARFKAHSLLKRHVVDTEPLDQFLRGTVNRFEAFAKVSVNA